MEVQKMPAISHNDAKECVLNALRGIADFSNTSNIEVFTFNHWHDFHKTVFINLIAVCISEKGSRIVLNEGMLDNCNSIGEFINYVFENSGFLGEPIPKMREKDDDLKS
jgi:hypothetical protein